MKRIVAVLLSLGCCLAAASALSASESPSLSRGEALFSRFCAACHANGGNIMNPQKTLMKKDREANNIKTADDIIAKMRNIGPAAAHPDTWLYMQTFDKTMISDEDARDIANYVLKTFN